MPRRRGRLLAGLLISVALCGAGAAAAVAQQEEPAREPVVVAAPPFQLRGTGELPLSSRVAFVFCLGLDVHGRAEDAIVMPMAALGLSLTF